jgi:hypothetical protein
MKSDVMGQKETNQMHDSTIPKDYFSTNVSAPRRDWFDRFTDWVAAVISLFE